MTINDASNRQLDPGAVPLHQKTRKNRSTSVKGVFFHGLVPPKRADITANAMVVNSLALKLQKSQAELRPYFTQAGFETQQQSH